ncbi:MAG: hypothetical protein NTZ58_07835 [Solirubrobacterales bacterium]|nr:hypothetical protein [Solirubrobacterales bacterium]
MVGRVIVPAERRDVVSDLSHERQIARQRAHVVAGLLEIVERIGQLNAAVFGTAQQEVLKLGSDPQLVSKLRGAGDLVLENRARAERPRLTFDRHVASEAGDVR